MAELENCSGICADCAAECGERTEEKLTPEQEKELYRQLIMDTFEGIQPYIRDTNLEPTLTGKYRAGMVILEKGITDASGKESGIATTHRYTILSNHMSDMHLHEDGTDWDLHVAGSNSRFKVLDVYEHHGRWQILLLHLVDDERWHIFAEAHLPLEDQLTAMMRQKFDESTEAPVLPELTSRAWQDRCADPIGMNAYGRLFDLEPKIADELKPMAGSNFRCFYHRFVYIECRELLEKIYGAEELRDDLTGMIAYGYIDEAEGLSFLPATLVSIQGNDVTTWDLPDTAAQIILRYRDVDYENEYVDEYGITKLYAVKPSEHKYFDATVLDINIDKLRAIENYAQKLYDTHSWDKEELRRLAYLDTCRNESYPDDIKVHLVKDRTDIEESWVRCTRKTEDTIYGILLTEPYQKFGVKVGDEIGFHPIESEGKIACAANLNDL